jgi:hypothetical protein
MNLNTGTKDYISNTFTAGIFMIIIRLIMIIQVLSELVTVNNYIITM